MLFLNELKSLLAYFFILVCLISLVFHLGDARLLLDLLQLEFLLVLNGALLQILDSLLQLSLVNIELFSARDREVCRRLADQLRAHLSEALE